MATWLKWVIMQERDLGGVCSAVCQVLKIWLSVISPKSFIDHNLFGGMVKYSSQFKCAYALETILNVSR